MSIALSSIIDIDRYAAFVGIAPDATPDDLKPIEAHIDAASVLICRYCNRTFIAPTVAVEEIFDGNGTCQCFSKNAPIITTAAPTLKWYNGTAWETVTGAWTYETLTGLLYFTDSSYFYRGLRNYKLTYLYGYLRTNIPADLAYACAQLVFRTLKKLVDKQEGVASESFDTHNISYDLNKIPPDLRAILDSYKVVYLG